MQRPKDDAPHLEWALYYASLGWQVYPAPPGKKHGGYHYPEYKNPKNGSEYSWKYQASSDPERVRKFWTDHPEANIGMLTGDASGGVVVLDVDTLKGHGVDGVGSINRWQQEHGALPDTILAISGSGSRHYFFKLDGGKQHIGVLDGVDVIGNVQVILPPTNDGRHWKIPPGAAEIATAAGDVKELLEGRPDPLAELLAKRQQRERFQVPDECMEGSRTDTLFKMACSMQAQGHSDDVIRMAVYSYNDLKCEPPLSDQELEQTVFTALERYDKPAPKVYDAQIVTRLQELGAADAKRYSRTDKGNSKLFADVYRDRHRYCPEWKEWAYYDGRIWAKDAAGEKVRQRAKELTDALMVYAPSAGLAGEEQTEYYKHVAKLNSYRTRETMIKDAWDNMVLHATDLDTDPLALNVQNGVLDLTGAPRLLPHAPGQSLSKIANVNYDPAACCPTWLRCLDEWMEGDNEKIAFLQQYMGICLTGDTREETMVILYGPSTRNGKSVFVETFKKMLGDYADTIAPESLATRDRDSRHASGDIAKLVGVRLVVTSEPPRNMPLDTARIKAMLGRDTITARQLYQMEFSFVPAFKLIMNTNYLPGTSDDTAFSGGRLNVVLFNRHFSEDEQDKTLLGRLQDPAEQAGILNWALEGLMAYRRNKRLAIPASVKAETDQYRADSDKIATFINDCMVKDPNGKEKASDVYRAYYYWCDGEKITGRLNRNTFYDEMRRRGIEIGPATIYGRTIKLAVIGYRRITPSEDGEATRYWCSF